MSHSIRLRGPWEFSVAGTPVAGRIEFPCDWSQLGSAEAPVTFRRYFHLPTGLEPGDHVLLVMRHAGPFRSVKLNGTALRFVEQPGGSVRADLTGMLAPRNELTIDLEPPSPAPPHMREAILEVALEIHPA